MSVFLSYSSQDDKMATELDLELRNFGANIFRDKRDLHPLENITTFMQSISKMDYAIMLISRNYLTSRPCIYEFSEYLKKKNAEKSIIPVLLPGFKFSNNLRNEIISHIHSQASAVIDTRPWYKKILYKPKTNNEVVTDWLERFECAWTFLADTKLIDFNTSKSSRHTGILAILGVYDAEIQKELDRIAKISNIEDQDIEFIELAKKHPRSYWILRYRAYLCTRQKQYKKAIVFYKEFMSKFPKLIDQVTTYYDIGVCFYKLGHYIEAARWHKDAIKIWPHAYLSHKGLGDVYLKLNHVELAYKHLLISDKYEQNYLVRYNLAHIAMKLGDVTKAIGHMERAIQLNSNDASLFVALASFHSANENEEMCDRILSQAYQKFPNDHVVLTRYAVRDLKESYQPAMIEILRKSYKLNAQYIDTRINLGIRLILVYCNPEKKEDMKQLMFAKKMLMATLKMNVTKLEREVICSNLKLLVILLKDKDLEKILENEIGWNGHKI